MAHLHLLNDVSCANISPITCYSPPLWQHQTKFHSNLAIYCYELVDKYSNTVQGIFYTLFKIMSTGKNTA